MPRSHPFTAHVPSLTNKEGILYDVVGVGNALVDMIAMVDEKLSLSAQTTAWIVGAAAIGGLIVPVSIGSLIDTVGSTSMPVVVLGVCAVGFVWVFVVQRSISRASGLHRTSVLRQA